MDEVHPSKRGGLPLDDKRPVLDVADVMARYGLADPRTARRVMDAAGAFLLAGRLRVREADLLDYEERLRATRAGMLASPEPVRRTSPRRRGAAAPTPSGPLAPGWWREDHSTR